jgi:hypothetical protein
LTTKLEIVNSINALNEKEWDSRRVLIGLEVIEKRIII